MICKQGTENADRYVSLSKQATFIGLSNSRDQYGHHFLNSCTVPRNWKAMHTRNIITTCTKMFVSFY